MSTETAVLATEAIPVAVAGAVPVALADRQAALVAAARAVLALAESGAAATRKGEVALHAATQQLQDARMAIHRDRRDLAAVSAGTDALARAQAQAAALQARIAELEAKVAGA